MSMTRMIAARLNSRLTKLDTTRLMGKINLGTYTFLIRDELPSTLPMPILVLLVKEVEQRVAADEVEREVLDLEAEHIGKYQRLQQHHQQGVQDAPHIAEEAAAVFYLEVAGDQLADQRPVLENLSQLPRSWAVVLPCMGKMAPSKVLIFGGGPRRFAPIGGGGRRAAVTA